MLLAHVIELRPTTEQIRLFKQVAGVARKAYNWALARWTTLHAAGEKTSWMALQREFTALIDAEFPYCRLVPSTAYAQPFRHVGKAFTSFLKGRARYPRFKAKHRTPPSFKLSGDTAAINLRTLALRGTDARGEIAPRVVQGNLVTKRARGTVNRHAPRARKNSPTPVGMCRQ